MLLFSIIISNGEDRVLFMLIHLTGVLCPLLKFFSSYQVLHLFSTGVLSEFVLPCFSFLTECFQLRPSLLFSSLNQFNLARFFGFTRLSKKQLSFTYSLSPPFSLRCHSRSRDEILSQWWSVVTPQDRCSRRLPQVLGFSVCFIFACSFYFCIASCHHAIMPFIFKTHLNKLHRSFDLFKPRELTG